jgi:hypothetical protein
MQSNPVEKIGPIPQVSQEEAKVMLDKFLSSYARLMQFSVGNFNTHYRRRFFHG